jgi:hypothetical protein
MDMSSNPPQEPAPQQSSYVPPPPPPPQPAKKGFNWLACCGISCLVLVIIGALLGWGCYRMVQPFIGLGMEMAKIQQDVSAADASTIRGAAIPVTTDALNDTPIAFEKQWVAVEGKISTDVPSSSSFSAGDFDSQNTTQYMLEGNVIVMDVSRAPKVGSTGDTIRAYGKIVVWDMSEMSKMPFFGKVIEEEMKKEPELAKNTKMIFVIAKEVELVTGGGDESSDGAPPEESSGWVN